MRNKKAKQLRKYFEDFLDENPKIREMGIERKFWRKFKKENGKGVRIIYER